MKKLVTLFALVGLMAYSSYALAQTKVDLQIRNVCVERFSDGNSQYSVEFLCAVVQNNGPDDFDGTFSVSASAADKSVYAEQEFTGKINQGETVTICVIGSPATDCYDLHVDCGKSVSETNEDNNYFYFLRGNPQVGIISGWRDGDLGHNDTLRVLPGEFFYSQFSLQDFNNAKSIIGVNYSIFSFDFGHANSPLINFGIQSEADLSNGTYSFKDKDYYYNNQGKNYPETSFTWMADNSDDALSYLWLGNFSGENTSSVVGEVKDIYINADVALMYQGATNTTSRSISFTRSIKTIDRVRGDVNDDGVVDQTDIDILTEVVAENLYNPCIPTSNIYQEHGINYGAGIVLFSRPDFVSNCLLNIWIHDKTDPLVQGFGIGELMSARYQPAVEKVSNSFSINGSKLAINAPGADLYNVAGQTAEGKAFQVTGKIGEQIVIPEGLKRISVETVKIRQNATSITSSQKTDISVYPNLVTDYVTIKSDGKEAASVKIIDLGGKIIFSSKLQGEELKVDASNWTEGIYLVNLVTNSGKKTVKIIKGH